MKKLIIIPAYNEDTSIVNTVKDIIENANGYDYIIINDCSSDSTLNLCCNNRFCVINLPINLGIGGAVQTGYKYAYLNNYDYVVQIDGDGQHNPKYLDAMFKTMIEEDADMVIGSRFINKIGFQSTKLRRIGIRYFSTMIYLLTGYFITDPTSGFRMVNKRLIEIFAKDYPRDYPEPESIVFALKNKFVVKEVPVIMRSRQGGVSSISFKSSIYYMIKVSIAIILERIRGNGS